MYEVERIISKSKIFLSVKSLLYRTLLSIRNIYLYKIILQNILIHLFRSLSNDIYKMRP